MRTEVQGKSDVREGTGMRFALDIVEMDALFRQDPTKRHDGGYQSLLVGLQESCERTTGEIAITLTQRARIQKYAFKYGNGGWEDRLTATFARHLGPNLDQSDETACRA